MKNSVKFVLEVRPGISKFSISGGKKIDSLDLLVLYKGYPSTENLSLNELVAVYTNPPTAINKSQTKPFKFTGPAHSDISRLVFVNKFLVVKFQKDLNSVETSSRCIKTSKANLKQVTGKFDSIDFSVPTTTISGRNDTKQKIGTLTSIKVKVLAKSLDTMLNASPDAIRINDPKYTVSYYANGSFRIKIFKADSLMKWIRTHKKNIMFVERESYFGFLQSIKNFQ